MSLMFYLSLPYLLMLSDAHVEFWVRESTRAVTLVGPSDWQLCTPTNLLAGSPGLWLVRLVWYSLSTRCHLLPKCSGLLSACRHRKFPIF